MQNPFAALAILLLCAVMPGLAATNSGRDSIEVTDADRTAICQEVLQSAFAHEVSTGWYCDSYGRAPDTEPPCTSYIYSPDGTTFTPPVIRGVKFTFLTWEELAARFERGVTYLQFAKVKSRTDSATVDLVVTFRHGYVIGPRSVMHFELHKTDGHWNARGVLQSGN